MTVHPKLRENERLLEFGWVGSRAQSTEYTEFQAGATLYFSISFNLGNEPLGRFSGGRGLKDDLCKLGSRYGDGTGLTDGDKLQEDCEGFCGDYSLPLVLGSRIALSKSGAFKFKLSYSQHSIWIRNYDNFQFVNFRYCRFGKIT